MTRDSTTILTPRSRVSITVTAHSHTGHIRPDNEDSYLARAPLFVVADGMGGHSRGGAASQAMVAQLALNVDDERPARPASVFAAITAANSEIMSWSEQGGIAGTTVAGLGLVRLSHGDCHWMAFNIGDSRVYLWDAGDLRQITVDHSAVQELIDEGQLTVAEAATHPERNVITRAVGVEINADPDVWLMPVAGDQVFVICSDGLTREVTESQIVEVLAQGADDPAELLVQRALDAGARDNVTVVVVRASTVPRAVPNPGYHHDDSRSLGYLEQTVPRV